jgi:hypothetical protein
MNVDTRGRRRGSLRDRSPWQVQCRRSRHIACTQCLSHLWRLHAMKWRCAANMGDSHAMLTEVLRTPEYLRLRITEGLAPGREVVMLWR